MSAPDPDVALSVTVPSDARPPQLSADDAFLPRPMQFPDGNPSDSIDKHIH